MEGKPLPPTWRPCPTGQCAHPVLEPLGGMTMRDYSELSLSTEAVAASHAIAAAATAGDATALQNLLDAAGDDGADARDTDGAPALLCAARGGHADCAQILLARGAAVDGADRLGVTPLMSAAYANEPAAVRLLLGAAANPLLRTTHFETALDHAREVGASACVALLDAARGDEERLLDAVVGGDAARVRALLDGGSITLADVDALLRSPRTQHHRERCTALHWACAGGHVGVVDALCERGADADATDAAGWTPLMEAATAGEAGAVRALLAAGADPRRENRYGRTALALARQGGRGECAEVLAAAAAGDAG